MLRNLPNALTWFRVAVIPVFVAMFFLRSPLGDWMAFGLFAAASITDYLDGFLARRLGRQSAFGAFLDPVADKLLICSALMMMVAFGHIAGAAVVAALVILCREFLVSALREFLAGIEVAMPVTPLAKWKTTVQMVALGFLIVGDSGPQGWPVHATGEVLLWAAALLTLITGYGYWRKGVGAITATDAGQGEARS